jgi:RNA polymerase sigma-70 factor (ECF subfamily)|tara:strand:- start:281 stop:865 length:585 start_codon:yes stop_codon:yes gene_type:complete
MSNISEASNSKDEISNAELVRKSQFGDKAAFEQLVIRHQELVFSLAYKLTGNREMANDVAQEAFIRAWKAIEKFRGDSTFSTWIYRITVNTAWTLRKKAKKHNTLNIDDTYEPIVIDEKKDPELVAINSDLSSVLVNALDKIPIEQRIIVELKNIEGRSHKEIADYLDISVTAAKVRLHRAHQKLRQILEEVER